MKKWRSLIALMLALMCLLSGCRQVDITEGVPNPMATIKLSDGSSMRFELFVREAPNTVANFVELAKAGFYDGLRFFRIVPGVLIQSGDPKNNGTGGAEHSIQGEFEANGIENSISHTRGTISMARQSGYDTASSQFFIMQGSYPEYNGQYAAFGRAVDEGSLAVIDRIASTLVDGNHYPVGSVPTIESIELETFKWSYEAAKIVPSEDEEENKSEKK